MSIVKYNGKEIILADELEKGELEFDYYDYDKNNLEDTLEFSFEDISNLEQKNGDSDE